MCIQVLEWIHPKEFLFVVWMLQPVKDIFALFSQGLPGARQGGRGAGSVLELAILRVYCEFLCLREMLYR